MTIKTVSSADGAVLTIYVAGVFDFKLHAAFRAAYEGVAPRPRRYVVDLSQTEYLDSAALGMLLLLRKFAACDDNCVSISNAAPSVAKILKIANFQKLFKVA